MWMSRWRLGVLAVGPALALLAGSALRQVQVPDGLPLRELAPRGADACPRLSSDLSQLLGASDRDTFSAVHALDYVDGAVRVVVMLEDVATPLPQQYGLSVEVRYDNMVQGLAPLDTLCALSNDPVVRSVESPSRPAF